MKYNIFSLSKAIAVLLLALVLVACGNSQAITTAPAASANTSANQAATAAPTSASGNSANVSSETTSSVVKLNLNKAGAGDFLTVPGVGNRMVREFMEYRPYVSIQQFQREIGKYVDDAQVAEYEKYVYVPIAINDSDAGTLQQVPGLDATEAADLIAARPYASTVAATYYHPVLENNLQAR